ncbi:MAG: hypothetical protein ACLTXW_03060 [Christensenellales bacterium]
MKHRRTDRILSEVAVCGRSKGMPLSVGCAATSLNRVIPTISLCASAKAVLWMADMNTCEEDLPIPTIAHRYEPEMLIFGDVFVLTYKTAEV